MKKTLRERIAALAAMNVPALREQHRKVFGKEPVSSHRQFLFRKIAWRWQADEEGWQADKLRELARAIARDTPLRQRVITNAGKRRAGLPPEETAVATIEPDHDPRLPMPGGWIMKHHKGKTHVVKVLDDGRFEYDSEDLHMRGKSGPSQTLLTLRFCAASSWPAMSWFKI